MAPMFRRMIYTDHVQAAHMIRKVVLRQTAILNYVDPF
ncbi:hypothetical protein MicloDRAFT_00033590 [Microvirga lotononidis]|uniref:Uncharacterized protein n=1 Tax=Microvirga lotononidis TaxID=864069 RepID=I4YS67_9HYPH|nr:hypothetical protein MicloDRAFT_00033590 [Microvirga lotononidis]